MKLSTNESVIKWSAQRVTLAPVPPRSPSGAPVHARAAHLLARVGHAQSVRFTERMRTLGLRPKHFAVLNAIALADGASQQELGGRMGLDPSGLVGAIDELEALGLVVRGRDPADRRRYALGLTDEGTATLRRARRLVSEGARELLGPLDDDEVEHLVALLGKVAAAGDLEPF
jgi:MarR family transcriptional regulator, lower aerobic nicotinate degradation pathway regulator